MHPNSIQFSEDGNFMCGLFPWPNAGLLDVHNGEQISMAKGCWPSIAPDNSYLMWVFDGPHRNLIFHSHTSGKKWAVNVSGAPGIDGNEVYHPRWSNHDRFFSMTGPYHQGIYGGGGEVSVYVGRFNDAMTKVEEWVQVTDHGLADFFPDLWVKPGVSHYDAPHYVGEGGEEVVTLDERLVVEAELVEKTPMPTLRDIAPYTQTLVVYRYKVIEVLEGEYVESQLLAAHWGIVDREPIALDLEIGDRVQLDLQPYANAGALEGERLVMELSNMKYPLFYDRKGQ